LRCRKPVAASHESWRREDTSASTRGNAPWGSAGPFADVKGSVSGYCSCFRPRLSPVATGIGIRVTDLIPEQDYLAAPLGHDNTRGHARAEQITAPLELIQQASSRNQTAQPGTPTLRLPGRFDRGWLGEERGCPDRLVPGNVLPVESRDRRGQHSTRPGAGRKIKLRPPTGQPSGGCHTPSPVSPARLRAPAVIPRKTGLAWRSHPSDTSYP
jgi:hypothetical protein